MNQVLRRTILFADLLWCFAAYAFASVSCYGLRGADVGQSFWSYLPAVFAVIVLWTILSTRTELHGFHGGWNLAAVLSQSAVGVMVLTTLVLAIAFLARLNYSRVMLVTSALFLLVGFVGIRCIAFLIMLSRSRMGAARRVAILGSGRVARELASKIMRHPELMWQIVGFIYPSGEQSPASKLFPDSEPSEVSVPTIRLLDLIKAQRINELLVVLPEPGRFRLQKLIPECRAAGISVSLIPQWYELYVSQAKLVQIDSLPLVSLEQRSPSIMALGLKRAIDIVGSVLLLIVASPVLILVGAALRFGKGRAFRAEPRCGLGGRSFQMFRFNVDRDDVQLAGYQRWVAQLSLTELPQLLNILLGDMSLVGPRPEPADRVKHYSEWHRQRLSVRPGLTGLGQVHGLREKHSSEEKARFDLQYIYYWSLFLDLSLIVQTVATLVIRLWRHLSAGPQLDSAPASLSVVEVANVNSSQSGAD